MVHLWLNLSLLCIQFLSLAPVRLEAANRSQVDIARYERNTNFLL
jgi:hypothetical protein